MTHHYNPTLVVVSLFISILACWMALEFSCRVHAQKTFKAKVFWHSSGAIVMGVGIWAMHYVGMLAYQVDFPVYYHWPTVLLSFLAAVLSSAIALILVSRNAMTWRSIVVGGIFMGGGIASMHYIGMAAMRMPCRVTYTPALVILSLFLAVIICMAALHICFHSKQDSAPWTAKKFGGALLMGAAIPIMHYVGMAAAHMQMMGNGSMAGPSYLHAVRMSQVATVGMIAAITLFLCFALLLASIDRSFLHVASDLHQTRQDHDLLRSYQHRLTQAYRQNGVGAWEWDPQTNTFAIDPSIRALYDIDEEEGEQVPRRFLLERVHPDDAQLLQDAWTSALSAGTTYDNEYRIVLRNGKMRRCRSVATIARHHNGDLLRVFGMSWDVTAERQQQIDYEEQAQRFYMTLQAIGDAVISVDAEQKVMYANPVACELTGWSAEDCLGRPLVDIFIALDEGTGLTRRNPVQRCMDHGGVLLSENAILLSRSGKRYNIRKLVNLVGAVGAVITFQDITSSRQLERDLVRAATHDALTDLPNRAAFDRRLNDIFAMERTAGRTHCLALLDLDRFKIINDTSGHLAGDAFLKQVVSVLQANLRSQDFLARMGGDEFLILLMDASMQQAEVSSRRLLLAIEDLRFAWQHRTYAVTASLGLALFDDTTPSPDVLLSRADVAMSTAKRKGRNQFASYTDANREVAGNMEEMEVVAELRSAIEDNRFEIHAQPIVPLHESSESPYFELLVRMRDPDGTLIPPAKFIPAAERYGMMQLIDRWVIQNAFRSYAPSFKLGCGMHFAINLSAESLSDPTLWAFVYEQFQITDVPPSHITFEVTESGLIQNVTTANTFLKQAQQVGCRVALDDFGTGMSSLSYLKHFTLDVLKIDGSFVRQLLKTPLDQSIVRAVSEIAHSMGAVAVAECAEHPEQVAMLATLGVDYVQGWATGRPEPLNMILERAAIAVLPHLNSRPSRSLRAASRNFAVLLPQVQSA